MPSIPKAKHFRYKKVFAILQACQLFLHAVSCLKVKKTIVAWAKLWKFIQRTTLQDCNKLLLLHNI